MQLSLLHFKNGDWMELNKESGKALPSGFPHTMYLSDAHNQMLSGLPQKKQEVGASVTTVLVVDDLNSSYVVSVLLERTNYLNA